MVHLEGDDPRIEIRREDGDEGRRIPWRAKTKRGHRTVVLGDETVEALEAWRELADGSPYVFIDLKRLAFVMRKVRAGVWDDARAPLNHLAGGVRDRETQELGGFAKLQELAGVTPAGRIHDFRHTVVCDMLEQGRPPQVVADHIGDTVETVMAVYAKVQKDRSRKGNREALNNRGKMAPARAPAR